MRDTLAKADPKQAARKAREEAQGMTREELVDAIAEMAPDVRRTEASGLAALAVGTGVGSAVGELVNGGLYKYAKTSLPLSGFVSENYATLRFAPHAVLGVAAVVVGRRRDTMLTAGVFSAGLGLLGPALARYIDTKLHEGDLAAAQEQSLRLQVEALKKQLEAKK